MSKATPTDDTDYSCYIKAVEFIQPIMEFILCHTAPLVIDSLGGGHTHTHTYTHSYGVLRQKQLFSSHGDFSDVKPFKSFLNKLYFYFYFNLPGHSEKVNNL